MTVKVNYETKEACEEAINHYTSNGYILIEHARLLDENYLVFGLPGQIPQEQPSLEKRIEALESAMLNSLLL